MQDEQTDEAAEPTAEDTSADGEGATPDDAASPQTPRRPPADPVDQQAADASGAAAEAAPEVPDDARDRIARAQEHLEDVDLDAERKAADRLTESPAVVRSAVAGRTSPGPLHFVAWATSA